MPGSRPRPLELCVLLVALPWLGADEAALEPLTPLRDHSLVEWRLDGWDAEDGSSFDLDRLPRLEVRIAETETTLRAFPFRQFRWKDGEAVATGPLELRFRHCFPRAGRHRWRILPPEGKRVLAEGVWEVAQTNRPEPPVAVSPHHPRLLAWSDGEPLIPIGLNCAWATGDDRLGTYLGYLDRLEAEGGNHVRVWMASWFGQMEGNRPYDYRLDEVDLIDRVLAAAEERGILVTLVLDNHHDLVTGRSAPYGETVAERVVTFFSTPLGEQYRQRIAYFAARFGPRPNLLAWELFNEMDMTGVDEVSAAHWVANASHFLAERDPLSHLITVSNAEEPWPKVWEPDAIDLIQVHQYVPYLPDAGDQHKDAIDLLLAHQPGLLDQSKPFLFSELGHQGTNEDNPGNQVDSEGLLFRQQLWGGLLCGGYGSGMNWWWDVYVDRHDLWHHIAPLAETVKLVDWRDSELRVLRPAGDGALRLIGWQSPSQAIIRPVQRSDTWYRTAVEGKGRTGRDLRARGVFLTGMRPETPFILTGVDTLSGEPTRRSTFASDKAGELLIPLDENHPDEVIILKRVE